MKEATGKSPRCSSSGTGNNLRLLPPLWGEEDNIPYKCWQVANVPQMTAASLFLGEKKQPAVLSVLLERKEQIPSPQLLPFLRTLAKEFKGQLKLLLQYSWHDYEPVDSVIEPLEGAG